MRKFITALAAALMLAVPASAAASVNPGPPNQADHPMYNSTTYLHIGDAENFMFYRGPSYFGGVYKTVHDDCVARISDAAHGCIYSGTVWSVRNATTGNVSAKIYGITPAYRRFCRYSATVTGVDTSQRYTQIPYVEYCGKY